LGDVVLTFAACDALRRARPDLEIVYLVKRAYEPLVRAQPWASEVLALDDSDRGPGGARRLAAQLAGRPWDAVLDLQGNARSRYIVQRLGGKQSRWRSERLARRSWVWLRPFRALGIRLAPVRPAWLRFVDAARRLEPQLEALPPRVRWDERAEQAADEFLRSWRPGSAEGPIAIAPAAAWPTKEWPQEKVLELARGLVESGRSVVFVSTPEERARLGRLSEWASGKDRVAWFDGDLLAIAALLARCPLAITPDSGLLHLACAVGTPAIALFGSTVPELGFAPAGEGNRVIEVALGCRPCSIHGRRRCPLGHFACMRKLDPRVVLAQALDRLSQPRLG
jgi:heptosyltransferase-2